MDFWDIAKGAFKNVYINGFKSKIKLIGTIAIAFILLVAILVCVLLVVDNEDGKKSNESTLTLGNDYVVNTAISESKIIIKDEQTLRNAINSLPYTDEQKTNLISNIPAFLDVQDSYNVNAVFAMAVTMVESGAGTGWDLIDSSTYNWYSIKAGASWNGEVYVDRESTSWRKYNSFEDATYDFGELISTSTYYFGGENYTVSSIAVSYCNEEWGVRVIKVMTDIFEACGIDTSGYIDISGSELLSVAANIFNKVYQKHYTYGYSSIPCENGVIDCSSYVDWVMYELGYTDFGGAQRNTEWWYNMNASAYGWIEFYIQDNDINVLQPGDIIVLRGTSYNKVTGATTYRHHMQIFVSKKDENHAYVYDCGGESNWSVSTPTKGDSTFWAYKDAKVIRIVDQNTNMVDTSTEI